MSFNKIILGANHPSIDPTNVTSHIRRCNAPSLLWWATIPGYWLLEKYAVTLPASWLHWWQKILLNLNLRAENYMIDLFEVKLILFWRDFVPLDLTSIIVPIPRTILVIIFLAFVVKALSRQTETRNEIKISLLHYFYQAALIPDIFSKWSDAIQKVSHCYDCEGENCLKWKQLPRKFALSPALKLLVM